MYFISIISGIILQLRLISIFDCNQLLVKTYLDFMFYLNPYQYEIHVVY